MGTRMRGKAADRIRGFYDGAVLQARPVPPTSSLFLGRFLSFPFLLEGFSLHLGGEPTTKEGGGGKERWARACGVCAWTE
jgi:hypothetical protein